MWWFEWSAGLVKAGPSMLLLLLFWFWYSETYPAFVWSNSYKSHALMQCCQAGSRSSRLTFPSSDNSSSSLQFYRPNSVQPWRISWTPSSWATCLWSSHGSWPSTPTTSCPRCCPTCFPSLRGWRAMVEQALSELSPLEMVSNRAWREWVVPLNQSPCNF